MHSNRHGLKYYAPVMLKGSIAQTLSNAATQLVSILLLPIITAYLNPKDFGIFSMVATVETFLSLLYNPGLLSATVRMYHDTYSERERKKLIGSALRFVIYFPLICSLIFLIVGPLLFPVIFKEFSFFPWGILAIFLALFIQVNRLWSTLMSLQYKVYKIAIFSFISMLGGTLVTLVLVVGFKLGALGKVIGMFPPALILSGIGLPALLKYSEGNWSFENLKKQLKMGFPLIMGIWSYSILYIGDRYMLERMVDITSVGIYSLGYKIAQLPMFFVNGVRQLWNPVFYENMNNGDYKTTTRLVEFYVAVLGFAHIFVIMFTKEIMHFFINKQYKDAIPIIGVIVIGVFFSALLTISNSMLGFEKKFGTTSIIATIAAISNIVLNLWLIPKWGIMGAAFTTAISYFLYLTLGLYKVRDMFKIIPVLKVLLFSAIAVVLSYLVTFGYIHQDVGWHEFIIKVLFIFIFISIVFLLRIIKLNDIRSILQLFRKRFRREYV